MPIKQTIDPESDQKEPGQEKGKEKPRPVGVYLSISEKNTIDNIAKEKGFASHAVLKYAVLYFLKEYQAGRIQLERENRPGIKKP
jgi:hypothetical protein